MALDKEGLTMGTRRRKTLEELKADCLKSYYHWNKYQVKLQSMKRKEEKRKEFQEYLDEELAKYKEG